MNPAPMLEPIIAATMADPGAVLTTAFRLSHLARRWGLKGPVAGALASLAYGDTRDE